MYGLDSFKFIYNFSSYVKGRFFGEQITFKTVFVQYCKKKHTFFIDSV